MMEEETGRRQVADAIIHTAARMDFHGRWERLCSDPAVIADIGHNAHGLKYNFSQLEDLLRTGTFTDLIIIYGAAVDKDVDAVFSLMPDNAEYVFTNASGKRAMPSEVLMERYLTFCNSHGLTPCPAESADTVAGAVSMAFEKAMALKRKSGDARPLVYIGGSAYVVSEAVVPVKEHLR